METMLPSSPSTAPTRGTRGCTSKKNFRLKLTTIPHEEVTPPCDSETVSLSGVTFATETTMQETQPNNG